MLHARHVKYVRKWFYFALLALSLVACSDEGENGGGSAPFVPPQAPQIEAFSAEPSSLDRGSATKLSWRVTGEPPPQLTLSPAPAGGGNVTGQGSVTVSPSESTTYTLSAENEEGRAQQTVEVSVSEPIELPPGEVSVTLNPGVVDLAPGQTQVFSASVTEADDQGVTWQVSGGGGSLEPDGASATYTAPSELGTYQITATSTADPTKSATATVNVSEVGVSITPASETLEPGQSRTFSAEVMGTNDTPNSSGVTWSADGGDVAADGTTATYTAPDTPGDYTLTATSTADPTKSAVAAITVSTAPEPDPEPGNNAPEADFTFTQDALSVSFDASASADSDGSITAYAWDFGDGATGEGETASHTYGEAGTYTVTLTVTDDSDESSAVEKSVEVVSADAPPSDPGDPPGNEAPSASFTFSTSELEVSFDASASADEDGNITAYTWDFGDGETGEGETVSHTYDGAGTFEVTLVVTDDDGESAQVVKSVEVAPTPLENDAPQASFSASFDELTGTFDASDSTDPDGSIVTYDWDFGDGEAGEGESVSHTYADAGTYTVTLTVTDDGGKSAQVEKSVEVAAAEPIEPPSSAPSVLFSFTPKEGDAPLTVTFDAADSTDPDDDIASYTWDFGDSETGEGVQVEHTYADEGEYTVTLTLEDEAGNEATASKFVEVALPDVPDVPDEAEAGLIITEVSTSSIGSPHWLEVYNASDEPLNLEDFELRTLARERVSPYSSEGVVTFALPPLNVPAGDYALVIGESGAGEVFDGPRHVHVRGDEVPAWGESGFAELLEDDATLDFVRFGDSDEEPESPGAWEGGSAPELGDESLARADDNADTNAADDWALQTFATAGGPNDVPANASDGDDDGIPDSAEVSGGTFAGLDLFAMGARTSRPDIFVEVDYMNTTDNGVTPQRAALDKVVAAFEAEGIALHFDAGTRLTSSFSPGAYNLGGGDPVVPFSPGIAFFEEGERGGDYANFYELKASYMDITRRQMFHYLIFANSQRADGAPGAVGLAEVGGNDLIVTLGGLGYSGNVIANFQAGSLMHELGHNLGLEHGGGDDTNDKPNYLSVMNYLYTLAGLGPATGERAGERYLLSRFSALSYTDLVNSPFGDDFVIDYSDGSGSPLDERSLNENGGLGRGASFIDFNNDGEAQSDLEFDLNDDGELSTLRDHDDWGNLVFPFSSTGERGDGISTLGADEEGGLEPLQDDRQPLADEPVLRLP